MYIFNVLHVNFLVSKILNANLTTQSPAFANWPINVNIQKAVTVSPSHIFGSEGSKGEDKHIRECANDPDICALVRVHTYQPKCAL